MMAMRMQFFELLFEFKKFFDFLVYCCEMILNNIVRLRKLFTFWRVKLRNQQSDLLKRDIERAAMTDECHLF